ncbi:two-component system protein B [Apiospora phragmitis]|uniref:Two-component system protein B n=1 Tax=Apiospora phragmitis TaxID=2905665 RepID=A0ABR1UTG5_9PEZI
MAQTETRLDSTIVEVLANDIRPTFIVEIAESAASSLPQQEEHPQLNIVHANPALESKPGLHDEVLRVTTSGHGRFLAWIGGNDALDGDTKSKTFMHHDICWSRTPFRQKWVIVGCNKQVAHNKALVKEQIAVKTKEANESIAKFQSIAEFIPNGACFGDREGNITFANDAWYRIIGVPKSTPLESSIFMDRILEEDRHNLTRAWSEMRHSGTVSIEFRVRGDSDYPLHPPIGSSPSLEKAGLDFTAEKPKTRYISAALKGELSPDGTVVRVLACLTDVTLYKLALEEALRHAQQHQNFKEMAESATVGMYELNMAGHLQWANTAFYRMCGLEKPDIANGSLKPFESCVVEEDLPLIQQSLDRLVAGGRHEQRAEIRLKKTWTEKDSSGNEIIAPRWASATFMPVKNSEDTIQTFTGCLVDMSLHNWRIESERQHKEEAIRRQQEAIRRQEEAIESKRQQENFIDMTSHELRNPLSAIIQCGDSILASQTQVSELLNNLRSGLPKTMATQWVSDNISRASNLVQNTIESAETVLSCTQHQSRIVDDILTMSKMDSNLLSVTPTTVNPILIVKEAFNMFRVEARSVDINLTMTVDPSYTDLNIEFLDLDPSRLKQVLINLLTNALKFTKNQAQKEVSIRMSASKSRPRDGTSSVQFIPRTLEEPQEPQRVQIGVDSTFLMFEVKDSGQGLNDAEKKSLFQRFVQASPKTHVKYGGSGLGLFISKRLTEMQNGAIGDAAAQEARETNRNLEKILKTPTGTPTMANHDGTPAEDKLIHGVLIVEDNLVNQKITQRALKERGYNVQVANHGLEALELLEKTDRRGGDFPLSVIMMDMEMPIKDGLSCTRDIREMEADGKLKSPRIPIIAVSANARMEQIEEAKAAGCDDVLVKPYRIPELITTMEKTVRRLSMNKKENGEGTEK